ncbi:MAG: type II toxin-antitoxin system MqsA family antitoxin [Armatimonadetes bacterium]|nr:type II toxin-antitoxin system MqsA family antitoxin [Armatimonadota bacterium]
MVTRCYLCGGQIERRRVTAEIRWGEELTLVEDVPAWVCGNCGEAYFDAATCTALDRLRQDHPPARRKVEVPVYAFSGADY